MPPAPLVPASPIIIPFFLRPYPTTTPTPSPLPPPPPPPLPPHPLPVPATTTARGGAKLMGGTEAGRFGTVRRDRGARAPLPPLPAVSRRCVTHACCHSGRFSPVREPSGGSDRSRPSSGGSDGSSPRQRRSCGHSPSKILPVLLAINSDDDKPDVCGRWQVRSEGHEVRRHPDLAVAERTVAVTRRFWKAGDYDGNPHLLAVEAAQHSDSGIEHVRLHPKFLHATSHKWALGGCKRSYICEN